MTKRKHSRMMFRIIAAAMVVAMVSGTAIMTPIADIVGTNITAHAIEDIIAQGNYWRITYDDEDDNCKLTFFGTIPNSAEIYAEANEIYSAAIASASAPSLAELIQASWYFAKDYVTEVTVEEGTKTSADASYLFSNLGNVVSMDLSNLDTSNATNMEGMFYNCENLKTIIVSNGWNTDKVTNSTDMFSNCSALVGGKGTICDGTNNIDKTYARIDGGTDNPGYFTDKTIIAQGSYWKVTDEDFDGNYKLTIFGTTPNTGGKAFMPPWYSYKGNITEVTTEDGAKTSADASYLFGNLGKVTSMNLSCLDTSATENMSFMFTYCSSLTSLDVSDLNTSSVTNMVAMFSFCQNLTLLDLSSWDTSSVTNMGNMFYYCTNLTSLDLSGWNTSSVTDMGFMFYNCTALTTITVSNKWTAENASSTKMFNGCTALVGGKGTTYNADVVDKTYARIDGGTNAPGYFTQSPIIAQGDYWTAYTIDENQCKVVLKGKLTGMSGDTSTGAVKLDWESILSAIGSNYTITEISAEESTKFVGKGYKMFNVAKSNWQSNKLDTVKKIDLSNVDTSEMTDMSYFFCYCTGLEELNISSFDTSNTERMGSMFYHCHSLKSLDLRNFDTSKVTSVPYMFTECQSLESIDLSSFDSSKFDALSAWFDGCKKLTVIDMSNFSTPLVEYTQQMFRNCISLTTVFVGSGWTTEKVSTDRDMFTNTTAIVGGMGTTYDSTKTDKTYARIDGGTNAPGYLTDGTIIAQGSYWIITDEDLDGNYKLTIFGTIPNTNGSTSSLPWYSYRGKITEVTTEEGAKISADASYLFSGFTNATSIDLSHLDTSNATNMYSMFRNCSNLISLDVSSWNTSNVTDMSSMFGSCPKLTTITVSNKWTAENASSTKMFTGCTSLVGGKGTTYDSTKTDKTYAKADGGKENPGYFTAITCTVTWKNGDTILETDTDVENGTTPSYDGKTPTKDSTAQYNYTFAGWTSDGGTTVYTAETLPALTGSVTYTAVFDEELITYPFTVTSVEGATITVYDEKNASVTELSGDNSQQLDGAVGFTFTSNMELVFDGATVSQSIEKPPIYINSITISINDGNIGNNSNIINEGNKENGNTGNTLYKYTVTAVTAESVSVSVYQVDIDELTITAPDKTYTGSALTPVVVKDGENTLVENTDYTVTYEDNTDVGTATAKITGKGKYKGEKTVEFAINPQDISALAVVVDLDGDGSAYSPTTYTADSDKPSITYDGKKYTPTAKLLFSNEEVPADSYDVSITPAQDADTYTITFTAKENTNFTGTRTFDWDITKADMTITMTDGLSFNRVGKNVALECVDESAFNVKGAPKDSTTTFTYFSESGLQLPKKPTEAGNYKVKAVVTNDNYNDGEATATFTIISNQAGDYYFSQTANNTILITGYAGDSTEVAIPETINGLPVTGIYYYAFEDSDITSITIPASVDMIYSYAFKNAKDLTDVYYEGSKTEWNKEVTVSNGNNLLKNATIHYALPENIYLDQTSLETTVGKSIRLLVSVSPVGTPADFTWESSDETVATVDENGNVTTLDFGTATITATADNGKTAVCELTVGHNGSNGIFEYTVSDDKKVTITKYIGTSDTVEVADKIDDMPIVAIAEGTFAETPLKTINYVGSKTMWNELTTEDLGDITVNYALPTSISLDETADVTKADTITLTPTVTPADTATTFTWKSANEEVATVDDKGVVTGVAYGTVNITATADNGQTATCAVTVTNIGEKDDFEYEIVSNDDKDTITITKYNGSAEEVNIPETINGISVTAIGAEAFKDNETMKDVIILLNVETIGDDAFAGCSDELNIHGYRRTDSERYATENEINFIAIPYPLENNSTISSTNADVNQQITVTGVGNEGTLSYKYAVYYKPTDSDTWTARQSYNKNNVVTLTFKEDGIYDICVKVKDTGGNVEKKYFVLTVTQPLTNTSTISANVITLGESFTVDMSAQDGSGTYEYAVETKPISETEWTIVSDYSADESVTITPDKAGVQNVCISVKDGFGTIKKKYFVVDVKYTAPSNISTISGDTIKVGESVTVNCAAENGSGTFQYGVYTKSVESAKWTTVQNFDENAEVAVTFDKPGIYQVCAKAMDTDGTIVKKYFAVEVTKDALLNKSTISASEIMAGESIDVNAVAEGGFGAYKYAVYYKLSESSKWTTVQAFSDNAQVSINPTKAGRYDICVKVADETNEIVKKYFMAEVKYEQLVNKCTLSADEVNFGETLTVTANAENGSGEYKYAVYMKSTERTAWNTVQDFSEQTEINVTFKNKGAYDICIKVMDSYGTISKTYTSVYVK